MRPKTINSYIRSMESLLGNTRRPDVSFFKNGRIDITAGVIGNYICTSNGVITMLLEITRRVARQLNQKGVVLISGHLVRNCARQY